MLFYHISPINSLFHFLSSCFVQRRRLLIFPYFPTVFFSPLLFISYFFHSYFIQSCCFPYLCVQTISLYCKPSNTTHWSRVSSIKLTGLHVSVYRRPSSGPQELQLVICNVICRNVMGCH